MEHLVLKVLSFDLAAPTINQFLSQYFLHNPASAQVQSLAMVSVDSWGESVLGVPLIYYPSSTCLSSVLTGMT